MWKGQAKTFPYSFLWSRYRRLHRVYLLSRVLAFSQKAYAPYLFSAVLATRKNGTEGDRTDQASEEAVISSLRV